LAAAPLSSWSQTEFRAISLEVGEGADVVLRVAQRQHRGQPARHQQVGGCTLLAVALGSESSIEELTVRIAGDVAGGGDHRVGRAHRRSQ
jgi:hypothetical protein